MTRTRTHINGIDIHYEIAGRRPAARARPRQLGATQFEWEAVTGIACRDVHSVIAYDRRGHSRSERRAAPTRAGTDEDDLAEIIESFAGARRTSSGTRSAA